MSGREEPGAIGRLSPGFATGAANSYPELWITWKLPVFSRSNPKFEAPNSLFFPYICPSKISDEWLLNFQKKLTSTGTN
jgi:hypothetical protein